MKTYSKKQALAVLQPLIKSLQPHTDRLEMVGDLLMDTEEVSEPFTLLAIVRKVEASSKDLFGGLVSLQTDDPGFMDRLNRFPLMAGNASKGILRRRYIDTVVQVQLANFKNFGLLQCLHNGEKPFIAYLLLKLNDNGYRLMNNQLYSLNRPVDTLTEQEVFKLARLHYIPPMARTAEWLLKNTDMNGHERIFQLAEAESL